MGTSKTMEFRPERSLKKISCLVLTLFIILIPKWTWAHSWAVQEPQEYFAKQLPLFIQTTERDLCPSETTLSSRCFLSLAKNSAKEITNVDSQNFAYLFIAISQSDLGLPNSIRQSIAKITNPSLRGIALTYLAKLHLRQENLSHGLDTMAKAQKFSNISPQAYMNSWLNILVADLFAILERTSESQNFIDQALQKVPLIKEHNTRSEIYALVAQTRLKNGQRTNAKKNLETAMMEVEKVRDPYLKSLALSFNSLAYHQLGSLSYSISTQELAEEYAQNSSPPSRLVAPAFLSSIQAKTGQVESALRSLKKTIEILFLVQSPYHRAVSFAFLAQTIFFAV